MSDRVQTTAGRGRAIAGALAGVAVVIILVTVFFVVKASGDDEAETPAAAPAPAVSAPAEPPAEVPSQPAEPPAGQSAPAVDPRLTKAPEVKAGKGDVTKLVVTPLVPGRGPRVKAGQQLTVNYVGVTYSDGKVFDSSWVNGQPATFPVGTGNLIPGWDQGLVGVPVGSRIQLDIPADLAYGEKPTGGQPAGDLRFVVDILNAV